MRSFARNALARLLVPGFAAVAACFSASLFAPAAEAASITGTVTGPDGAPVRAAFVQARHGKLKMTVSVLTDRKHSGRNVTHANLARPALISTVVPTASATDASS